MTREPGIPANLNEAAAQMFARCAGFAPTRRDLHDRTVALRAPTPGLAPTMGTFINDR
jgi:hypothetical protein